MVFGNPFLLFGIKRHFYIAIIVNLLLWGNEWWALSSYMLQKLESFHSKCFRVILGITMWELCMYKVTNSNVLARSYMLKTEHVTHYRRFAWMGKIASMASSRNLSTFLNVWMASPRPIERTNLTTCKPFLKSLNYCHDHGGTSFKNLKCPNRKLEQWIPMARLSNTSWLDKIVFLCKPRFLSAVYFYKT